MKLRYQRGAASGLALAGAAAAGLLAAGGAAAQDAGRSAAALDEVVVTARKREENLQEVPLAIQAFSGERLEDAGVDNLRDLSTITNGLVMTDLGAEAQSSPVIRGISQTNVLRNGENNVSSFIDGVYLYNLNSINISLLDLQRVEVVKGPVSALYGRNSFAGAINYITRRPSLTSYEAKVEATAGSDERRKIVGAVSVPLAQGRFGLRLAGVYDSFDGTYEDPVNGNSLGGYTKRGAQLGFLAKPSDTIEVSGTAYVGNDELSQAPASYLSNNCAIGGGVARKFCGEIPSGGSLRPPEAVTGSAIPGVGNDREVRHANVHVSFDLGAWEVESVTGYNKANTRYFSEFNKRRNGLTYTVLPSGRQLTTNAFFGRRTDTKDFSEEIRFASSGEQRLRWQVGAFYYKLDIDTGVLVGVDGSTLAANERIAGPANGFVNRVGAANQGRAVGDTKQRSGFAVLDFDFTDALTASAEGRYTREDKFFNQVTSPTGAPDIDGTGRSDSWSFWDSRFTLKYQATDALNVYASAAKGTKAGGFNDSATVPQDYTYAPESNWTYEIGAKSSFLGNRLQLNGAVFYVDWKGVQLQRPSSDPANPAVQIGNVGGARAKGAELEFSLRAVEGLALRAGVTYSDVKFADGAFDITSAGDCALIPTCAATRLVTVNGRSATNVDGYPLPRQSKLQLLAGADLEFPLTGEWRWFAGADFTRLSKQYFETSNFAWWGPREVVNARAGVANGRLRVTLWGDNLTDDATPLNAESNLRLTDFVFETLPILPEQRTYGLSVTYRF